MFALWKFFTVSSSASIYGGGNRTSDGSDILYLSFRLVVLPPQLQAQVFILLHQRLVLVFQLDIIAIAAYQRHRVHLRVSSKSEVH